MEEAKIQIVHHEQESKADTPPKAGEVIRIGNLSLVWEENLGDMEDCSSLLETPAKLRQVVDEQGFGLLRGVIPKEKILAARAVVVETLRNQWNSIDLEAGSVLDAHIRGNSAGVLLTGYESVTHHPRVLDLLEGPELVRIFRSFFGGQAPASFNTKWVRIMGHQEFTDEHTDFFRFAKTAKDMYTCWIPLGNYPIKHGTLALMKKSHRMPGYESGNREEKMELPSGFDELQRTAKWATSHFDAGDIMIFDIRTIHASSHNMKHSFRISMDTRWQPSCHLAPAIRDTFRAFPAL